jgi:serine/threonine protein kinase/Tol biopolymer transport system component
MPVAAGTKLDGYEVLGLVGAGGMGEVYRARDSALKREVAIKVLPSFVSQDPDRLRRFEQEAQAAAALNHPNILAVHRFGVFEGSSYLVSELLEGSTLRQLLQNGPIPVRKAVDYGVQIAHGLAAAHEKGIVHRDLKPENLFVTKDGRVKILDFGLAKLTQHQPESESNAATLAATDPGMVMGTAGYMSPEQVRGKTVDHRTDIFAFGAILYEMLAGKRAFHRNTSAETMTAILNEEPPSISQIVQTAPPGLQRVIHRCLEKTPEQRFHSASDLAFALEALSDSGSAPVAALPQGSRSRWFWVAPSSLAAVLIASLIVWWRIPRAVPTVEAVTQLTDDGERKGSLATDGSRIYFNEGARESPRITQVSVTGGPTVPVESSLTNAYVNGLPHDGTALLAVVGSNAAGAEESLWLIPLPGGEPRRLGIEAHSADIFPDGRIIFSKFIRGTDAKGTDSRTDWYITDKDGLDPRKLISLPRDVRGVEVSPDGQRVLFEEFRPGPNLVHVMAADGTGLREIPPESRDNCCFTWSGDGKYLLYQVGNGNQRDIWALPLQTGLFGRPGEPIRLTYGPASYTSQIASRDGKQIFAVGTSTKPRGQLVRFDVKLHQFLPFLSGISATDPTFSRDGKWVAYASYPEHTLWRSRGDGTERMQLTFPPMDVRFPVISPDGTKVAFHTGKNELFVIDMQGGQPQKVTDNAYYAGWSPDGNYLLHPVASAPYSLQITDVRTGKSTMVPSSQGKGGGFWLSQDTVMVLDPNRAKFAIFNLKTQQWTDLPGGFSRDIEHFFPSPDGKYLYYSTGGANPTALRYRFADHKIEAITSLKDLRRAVNLGTTQINVAPDGSPIFTRDIGSSSEIYALDVRWPR